MLFLWCGVRIAKNVLQGQTELTIADGQGDMPPQTISVPTEKGKTMREKLIELLDNFMQPGKQNTLGEFADYLIANGVVISKMETTTKWIPVTERLPYTAERVLVSKKWLGMQYKPVYGYYQDFPNQKGCWYAC